MELIPWVIGIGVFAVIQQVTKTTAYRMAEASFLAPLTYTSLVWATLTGWIFWQDFPATSVLIGTAMVIGCNLLTTWRESQLNSSTGFHNFRHFRQFSTLGISQGNNLFHFRDIIKLSLTPLSEL